MAWIGIGNTIWRRGGGVFSFDSSEAPTGLTLTVISDTEIQLDWTVNSTRMDGHRIYYSTDGTTFTEKGTVSGSTATYNATGLTTNTRYYFKVVAYKSSVESNATSTQNDWTAMKIVLTSTGTGAGVATIRFWFDTVNTVATLDGNGRFYSDAGGTADESTSYTFPAGSLQTRYLKVTSGTSNLLVFHKNNMMRFGDLFGWGWEAGTNAPSLNINLANLVRTLLYISISGNNTINGNLSDLPSGLIVFQCRGSNTISGVLSDLPSGLTSFSCGGSNTISGVLSDLPSGLTYFLCSGDNTISGSLSDLPSGMTYFYCSGSNTISDYTSGRTWANNQNWIYLKPTTGYGLSSTEVDNLLIDLSAVATWSGYKKIELPSPNSPRTSASDSAVSTLTGKGVTVVTA